MTLNFSKAKLLIVVIMATIILSTACTHKKQAQTVTWLYNYGRVEMINGSVKKLTDLSKTSREMFIYYVYTFDKKGNVVTFEDIYQDGINTTKYNTVYNKNGKKVESIGLNIDTGRHIADVYKYDNYGHINIMYSGNAYYPSMHIYRFLYNEAGYLTERQECYDKMVTSIEKFKYLYNKKGVITGTEHAVATERNDFKYFTKDTTRYIVLDSQNNWLKAIRFGDTLIRKITYY